MSIYLITGASSGIGEQMARQAVVDGHKVYAVARRGEILEQMARELGENFQAMPCDVADEQAVVALCGNLPELPDIVILNAGIGDLESPKRFDLDIHKRTFSINYFGVMNVVGALYPKFAERKSGAFVGISSLGAHRGMPRAAAYGASKAALTNAFESMRLTYKRSKVRFITVHPGFVETPLTAGGKNPMPFIWKAEKAAAYILKQINRGKWHINFPFPTWLAMSILRFLPAGVHRFLMGV